MSESNSIEQTSLYILDIDDYPMVRQITGDNNGNGNTNNYIIESGILIGENRDIVKLFENNISLSRDTFEEYNKGFEFLKDLYNFQAYYSVMEKVQNQFAMNSIVIENENNAVMNIFTGGIDITNGGSNFYLNSRNIIHMKNVKTYHQAKFLRDCLVKYFDVMGINFG